MSDESYQQEFISKIVLELKPKSRRGCRRLFGIRENKYFNEDLFDEKNFTQKFLLNFNQKSFQRGQHINFQKLIIAVKHIEREKCESEGETEVQYLVKGFPLNNHRRSQKISLESLKNENEEIYSCFCSECQKCLRNGDFLIKTGNWSRPIVCLNCYETFYTPKCVRCAKSISFDQGNVREDGLAIISYVENNGLYWHSDCCVCVTCLKTLIGLKFYQDDVFNQLFCLDHIPFKV